MMTAWLRLSIPLVAAAVVAGCGGTVTQGNSGVPSFARTAPASSGDLLYVAHAKGESLESPGQLSIFTFPKGSLVGEFALSGSPTGVCADGAGNVWIVESEKYVWHAFEFAHGGNVPIAKIRIPNPNYASGCAIDPSSGDLAVFAGVDGSQGEGGRVDIWSGARAGEPAEYRLSFTPSAGAYDPSGNLFVDGYIGGSQSFYLDELAKGGTSFSNVVVERHTEFPGGVQWDGSYITVETGGLGRRASIYRLTVSNGRASVVGTTHPRDLDVGSYCLADGVVAGISGPYGLKVLLWPYPQGSAPTLLSRFKYTPRGLAISAGN
ncbi:MAG TPA: hypothetical protein VHT92_09795 [Candidatus Cybelea sp.]|jgi:hypothetical protein|nr:hypothetical protein [Candidatus Cybelea sp.]